MSLAPDTKTKVRRSLDPNFPLPAGPPRLPPHSFWLLSRTGVTGGHSSTLHVPSWLSERHHQRVKLDIPARPLPKPYTVMTQVKRTRLGHQSPRLLNDSVIHIPAEHALGRPRPLSTIENLIESSERSFCRGLLRSWAAVRAVGAPLGLGLPEHWRLAVA